MRKKLSQRKPEEPLLQVTKPQIDYRELTKDLLEKSNQLFNNNQRKVAHAILSQAIRYYYSQNLKIYKELTNFELLSQLRQSKPTDFGKVRDWLLLCGSVEYAKYRSDDAEFKAALQNFSKEVT